jgi:glutamyl-tRNA synthetase
MIRVRFAPSPTGALHIGSVRTALFNYLFARNQNGKFILRIEDTDTARSTEESVQVILDGMKWIGMEWDEGPFFQSERMELYRTMANTLLEKGAAYRCYCPPEDLEQRRKDAISSGSRLLYSGKCRELTNPPADKEFAIRLKVSRPGTVSFIDYLRGSMSFSTDEIDDFVLVRTDGTPTYNFSVVIDDHDMQITHVIRGDDHLNNTPKQLLIYQALGYAPPVFAHLPMILGEDKTRLSKRHGAKSVTEYREEGFLPEALLNYLARLGWSYGDQEIFSKQELIEKFSLDHVGKSAGIFNPEKLLAVNANHMRSDDIEHVLPHLEYLMQKQGIPVPARTELHKLFEMLKVRSQTLVEIIAKMDFFLQSQLVFDETAVKKFLTPDAKTVLKKLLNLFEQTDDFSEPSLEQLFHKFLETENLQLKIVAQPLRVALTGKSVSPGIFEVISVLGKSRTCQRIADVLSS